MANYEKLIFVAYILLLLLYVNKPGIYRKIHYAWHFGLFQTLQFYIPTHIWVGLLNELNTSFNQNLIIPSDHHVWYTWIQKAVTNLSCHLYIMYFKANTNRKYYNQKLKCRWMLQDENVSSCFAKHLNTYMSIIFSLCSHWIHYYFIYHSHFYCQQTG